MRDCGYGLVVREEDEKGLKKEHSRKKKLRRKGT